MTSKAPASSTPPGFGALTFDFLPPFWLLPLLFDLPAIFLFCFAVRPGWASGIPTVASVSDSLTLFEVGEVAPTGFDEVEVEGGGEWARLAAFATSTGIAGVDM